MDDAQLRDEAVRDRVRAAEEFLDPSTYGEKQLMIAASTDVFLLQATLERARTVPTSCSCSTELRDDW